jgi:hypothetical protein
MDTDLYNTGKNTLEDMYIPLERSGSIELCVKINLHQTIRHSIHIMEEEKNETFLSHKVQFGSDHFLVGHLKYLGEIGTYHISFITYV